MQVIQSNAHSHRSKNAHKKCQPPLSLAGCTSDNRNTSDELCRYLKSTTTSQWHQWPYGHVIESDQLSQMRKWYHGAPTVVSRSVFRIWHRDWRSNYDVPLLPEINRSIAKQNKAINTWTRTCVKLSYKLIVKSPYRHAIVHCPTSRRDCGNVNCLLAHQSDHSLQATRLTNSRHMVKIRRWHKSTLNLSLYVVSRSDLKITNEFYIE